jgi:hypothetical protein
MSFPSSVYLAFRPRIKPPEAWPPLKDDLRSNDVDVSMVVASILPAQNSFLVWSLHEGGVT